MSELKCLWLLVFISFPAALFLDAINIREGLVRAFFAVGIIAVITILINILLGDIFNG